MKMTLEDLNRIRSVAIVGASRRSWKPGYIVLHNFKRSFKGRIYPVNPSAKEILNLRCYPSLRRIPYSIDMIVVLTPEESIPEIIKDAIDKGVKYAVIISSISKDSISDEIIGLISGSRLRVLGPGSIGLYIPRQGINTLFNPSDKQSYPGPGDIGIVTQSGAIGTLMMDILGESGLGISKLIGLGMEWDITLNEALSHLYKDPDTKLITMYLEKVVDGREFYHLAREITLYKPILALAGGISSKYDWVVYSHTGGIVSGGLIEHVFKQAGIINLRRVDLIGEFSTQLKYMPLPRGRRIGVVTGAGGLGISLVDTVEEMNMEVTNYIDVGGLAGDNEYLDAVSKLYRGDDVDMIVLMPYYPSPSLTKDFNKALADEVHRLSIEFMKPLTVVSYPYGFNYDSITNLVTEYRVPVTYSTSNYLIVMRELLNYRRYLSMRREDRWIERLWLDSIADLK